MLILVSFPLLPTSQSFLFQFPLVSQIRCLPRSEYAFVLHIYLLCREGTLVFSLHWAMKLSNQAE